MDEDWQSDGWPALYDLLELPTRIPVNIWPWLFIGLLPVIILKATPEHGARRRFWRIVAAVGMGYVLLNLTLHTHRALDWRAYEACQSQFPDGAIQHHKECGEINIADGASDVFYLVLGWIPAAAYAGLWELVWRWKHRHTIRAMGTAYRGRWFSTLLIACSVPVWIFTAYVIMLVIYMRTTCPTAIVASDKCWISR